MSIELPKRPSLNFPSRIAICGLGRLGSNLTFWFARKGLTPIAIASRHLDKAEAIAKASGLDPNIAQDFHEAVSRSDLAFLAVPDGVIEEVAEDLARMDLRGRTIVHCSGAHPASLLTPVIRAGARIASFHPIQSFTNLPIDRPIQHARTNPFEGIYIGIDAEADLVEILRRMARRLGSSIIQIMPGVTARARYHAAAVMASNALVGLIDAAVAMMVSAGIDADAAKHALLPLVHGTLENLHKMSPDDALTGPVARVDIPTIHTHLEALRHNRELEDLYIAFTRRMIEVASRSGRISPTQQMQLTRELDAYKGA